MTTKATIIDEMKQQQQAAVNILPDAELLIHKEYLKMRLLQ